MQHEQRYRASLVLPRDLFPSSGPGSSAHRDQEGPLRGSWPGKRTGHDSEKLGEARLKCGLARGCRQADGRVALLLRAIPTWSRCSQALTDSAALLGC